MTWEIKRNVTDPQSGQPTLETIAVVGELEYHGEWMGEEYVTVDVKSPVAIDWKLGDFLVYRGEEYSICNDQNVIKKARPNTYGEGFVYDNVRFFAVSWHLKTIDFKDIVLFDNGLAYTSLSEFSFFASNVEDLADRLQANLNRVSGDWRVLTPDEARTYQRLGGAGWDDYEWDSSIVGESDVNINVTREQSCWDMLKVCYSNFGLSFYVKGYDIVIGGKPIREPHIFSYGKGNGLYEIERTSDDDQELVTKAWGYGSETNLPLNYYANLGKHATVLVRKKEYYESAVSGWATIYYISHVKMVRVKNAVSIGDRKLLRYGDISCMATVGARIFDSVRDASYIRAFPEIEPGVEYLSFYVNGNIGGTSQDGVWSDIIDFFDAMPVQGDTQGAEVWIDVDKNKWPQTMTIEESGFDYPKMLSINRLMLPGFPFTSLRDWLVTCSQDGGVDRGEWGGLGSSEAAGLLQKYNFSEDIHDPWVMSKNSLTLGILEGVAYFDGSAQEEICPTIKNTDSGVVYSGSSVTDNGYLDDGADISFTITVRKGNSYLDWKELLETAVDKSDVAIEMTSGYCVGRKFKVKGAVAKDDVPSVGSLWVLTLERERDSAMNRYFPYSDNDISNYAQVMGENNNLGRDGDTFVVTGIQLPSLYVRYASVKLLIALCGWLDKRDHVRYTYVPKVDEIFMARQHEAVEDGVDSATYGTVSLHDTLKAGMQMQFEDAADLGIERYGDASPYIDQLTIREGSSPVPTYEVVLRDEKEKGVFDKITEKYDQLKDTIPEMERNRRTVQYVEYDRWEDGKRYYYETLNIDGDNPVLETSRVWHYGILWECRNTGTTEEPSYGCLDWKEVGGDTSFHISLVDGQGIELGGALLVSRSNIDSTLIGRVVRGQEDVSAKVDAWSWDIIESDGTEHANVASTRQLEVTDATLPVSWEQSGSVAFKCHATVGAETLTAMLKMANYDISSYDIEFSDYVDVITVDDVGNCIGGIYTVSGDNNEHRSYRIHSAITVRKNGVPLLYSEPSGEINSSDSSDSSDASDDVVANFGFYKIYGEGHGCSFVIENSTLYITSVDNIKDGVPGTPDDVNFDYDAMRLMSSCSVDLLIDCEGVATIQKRFQVTIKHDSQPYVAAEISQPMSSVKWLGSAFAGLPIAIDITMSHNSEHLDIVSADNISITPAITGMTIAKSIVTDDGHKKGHIVISALPSTLSDVTHLSITCSAVYSGVSYERTLIHTITRLQDGDNGISVESYIESQEAWGDSTTTPPQSGWSDSTPTKNGKYLWRRSRKMVLDETMTAYEPDSDDGDHDGVADGEWKYQRLSGTDGTSIDTKGTVAVVVSDTLPTTGVPIGDLGIIQGDRYVRVRAVMQDGVSLGWNNYAQASNGDSYTITKDNNVDLDGDGITVNLKGHLVMWSEEATKWIDLGQFKGDPGVTYFTHLAWADAATGSFSGSIPEGQISIPNKSIVGNFSISPREGYDWMGLLINQTESDPTSSSKTYYTWQYTKGAKGDDAVMYWLEPSTQTVRVENNVSIPSTFKVRLMRTQGGVTQELTALPQGLSDGMVIDVYVDGTLNATYTDNSTPSGFYETYGQGASTSSFASCSYMEFRLRARTPDVYYDTKTITTVFSTVSWRLGASVTHFRFDRDYAGVLTASPATTSLRVVKSEGREQTVYDTAQASLPSHIHLGWVTPRTSAPSLGTVTAASLMVATGNCLYRSTTIGLYSGGTVQSDYTVTGGMLVDQISITSEITYQRMLIPQGEWDAAITYILTDRTCPLVLYRGHYYYLLVSSSTNNTPTENASNAYWAMAEEYEVLLTKALFARFANVGGFVFCENWFVSQYGKLVSSSGKTLTVDGGNMATPYGNDGNGNIVASGSADMRASYGWFDYDDPMATGAIPSTELRFVPALAMHAVTGETFLAGGKVHFEHGGNVSVEGTIKATNLYRNVCLFRQDENYSNDCYYCYMPPSAAFGAGRYYTEAEIIALGGNPADTFVDPDSFGNRRPYFIRTTYDADVVVMVPNVSQNDDGGWHTDRYDEEVLTPIWPMLPAPSDFVGKLVEISGWSRVTEEKNIHVGCVVYNAMSNGIVFDSQGNFAFAPASDEITIRTGETYKFMSMAIGNATRWVLLGK